MIAERLTILIKKYRSALGFGYITLATQFTLAATQACTTPSYANWNTGTIAGGYGPAYQMQLIKDGHNVSPWFSLPKPNENISIDYYKSALEFYKSRELPITLISTQWESLLSEEPYLSINDDSNPNVLPVIGRVQKKVSPFGDEKYWYEVGRRWTSTPTMAKLQQLYPSPPRIIFLSNNEHPKIRWFELELDRRYLKQYPATQNLFDPAYKQQVIADRWEKLYNALHQGMRDGLTNPTWKDHAIFAGYIATGSGLIGRDFKWSLDTLHTTSNIDPNVRYWDGASYSYYIEAEQTVARTLPVGAMNWVFMIKENKQINPNYFFELSVWDGHAYDKSDFRALQETKRPGSSLSTYLATVKFATWLIKPEIVREFRFYDETQSANKRYSDALIDTLDTIAWNATLKSFWCDGSLVSNPSRAHPYSSDFPKKYANAERWFLLNTSEDAPAPWTLQTRISVYAIAMVKGTVPHREWLVYAYSADEKKELVDIEIPQFRKISIKPSTNGGYFFVSEDSPVVTELAPAPPIAPRSVQALPGS